jgi:hypothetical protein
MDGKDFYFQLIKEPKPYFLITPKIYYDREGCLSDESGIAHGILPMNFSEETESTFSFLGNQDAGRELLLASGFIEIDFGFGAVAPTDDPDNDDYPEVDDEDVEKEYEEEETPEDDDVDNRAHHRVLDEIDSLLNEKEENQPVANTFDYKNMTTAELLRHKKVMVASESYLEAAKIQTELETRGAGNM